MSSCSYLLCQRALIGILWCFCLFAILSHTSRRQEEFEALITFDKQSQFRGCRETHFGQNVEFGYFSETRRKQK